MGLFCHPLITAGGSHHALLQSFIIKYYGNGKNICSVNEPLDTITTKDRFALIYPKVDIHGEIHLLDIHYRMLQPPELAAAQGFRKDYIFTGNKTQQIKQIGNAVPRHLARAIVLAALSQKPDIEHHALAA